MKISSSFFNQFLCNQTISSSYIAFAVDKAFRHIQRLPMTNSSINIYHVEYGKCRENVVIQYMHMRFYVDYSPSSIPFIRKFNLDT